MIWNFLALVSFSLICREVSSHGYITDPPNRSSLWRFGYDSPPNYDDNQLYCGGLGIMIQNGMKCGVCGDNYADAQPRGNEALGTWGLGIITREYKSGQTITVRINLTTSHLGHFQFKICPNNDVTKIVDQSCLDQYPLELADGSGTLFYVPEYGSAVYEYQVNLPQGLTCSQCVVQWTYTAGNNWGTCDDGTYDMGCGPQETFVNCADVTIS